MASKSPEQQSPEHQNLDDQKSNKAKKDAARLRRADERLTAIDKPTPREIRTDVTKLQPSTHKSRIKYYERVYDLNTSIYC